MSALFFLLAAALTALAVLLVGFPLFSARDRGAEKSGEDEAERRRQNIAAARRRMRELRARWERGEISEEDYSESRAEIERSLLDDLAAVGEERVFRRMGRVEEGEGKNWEDSGNRGKWSAAILCAVLPIAAGVLYLQLGEPRAILGTDAASVARAGGEDAPSMDGAIAALRARLLEDPENVEGWILLARSLATVGRFSDAADAFARARGLAGDEPDLLTGEAEARARAADGDFSGEAERLLGLALELNPSHPSALWLSGLAAMNRDAHGEAAEFWRRALPAVEDSEAESRLRELIAQAEARAEARAGEGESEEVGISVDISLSPELSADSEKVLFIFARAVSGPRIPLAAARRRAGDLPFSLVLTDSMAMTPELKLSLFERVDIVARISQSGTPQAGSGDLFGEVKGVAVSGGENISLVIDRRVE